MINTLYFFITCLGLITSILILSSLNPITKLALLIMVFLMVAFQFLILDFYFLGLTYIIVYVGAIAILFLFVIMLIQTYTIVPNNVVNIRIKMNEQNILGNISGIQKEENDKNFLWGDLLILNSSQRLHTPKSNNFIYAIGNSTFSSKNLNWLIYLGAIGSIILLFGGTLSNLNSTESQIYTFFYPSWSTLIYSLTDIQTLGYSLYLAYPLGIVILGFILWMVLIGILCISTQ